MDIYFVPLVITQYYFIYFAAWIIPASFLSGSRLILQIPFPILESAIFPTSSGSFYWRTTRNQDLEPGTFIATGVPLLLGLHS